MTGEPLAIRTEGLTRRFGELCAVDGLSIEVRAGTIFGFLGPNGSGKTTTIRLLLGLLRPTAGHARVLGHDTRGDGDAIRAAAGAVLEHGGHYERLTAEQNLEFHCRARRLPEPDRRARTRELLERFGLYERRQERVGTWSRGMRQKLALARALLHRPALLFLDEPTAGLDPEAAAALRDDIARLASHHGATVFLTTHNLHEAEKLCDDIAVIRGGRLLAAGPTHTLRPEPAPLVITGRGFDDAVVARVRARPEVAGASVAGDELVVQLAAGADPAAVVRTVVEGGGEVTSASRRQETLEDVYLELMRAE